MSVDRESASHERIVAQAARAGEAWRWLRLRLRGATPSGIAHALLIVAAVVVIVWVAVASWPALLPFVVGGIIAYTLLPVVNWLDQFMPRAIAALLTMAGLVGLVALIFWAIIPPLVVEFERLVQALPSFDEANQVLDDVDAFVGGLPAPIAEALQRAANQAEENVRTSVRQYLDSPVRSLLGGLRLLFDSIGFVLGFVVLPTWLLAVLNSQRLAALSLRRFLPAWLAPDFWAVLRILDRAFGAFVRGRIVLALAVGVCTWVGLTLIDLAYGQEGSQAGQYVLLLAVIAGIFTLVPTVGPIAGAIIGTLVGLTFSVEVAALVLLVFILAQLLVGWAVAPSVERRVVDLHPAILVMAIAALSQFGLIWVFVAAPLVAVARDLFRYAYGRVADPPLPAGVLPGEGRSAATTAEAGAAAPRRVPMVYRRGREAERA
jgi:predicted PurR-regulated permease PerM